MMTRDDLIQFARKACLFYEGEKELERFYSLVISPFQERIKSLYEQIERTEKMLDDELLIGIEYEREACAKLMEGEGRHFEADMIRARGKK